MVLTLVLTPCQTWGLAFYLDLTFTMIFKAAFSIYKGSEIKKLAKSILIICSPKLSSLTLGWPDNLLFEVQSPFKSGKGHYHAGKVGPNQDSPKQTNAWRPSTLLNLTTWLMIFYLKSLKSSQKWPKKVFPQGFANWSRSSSTLPTCLCPLWEPLFPLWKLC